MRIRIGSHLTKTNKRLAVLGTAALALSMSLAPNASAQDVRSTDVEVWTLPDLNPFNEGLADWQAGTATGTWSGGVASVGTGVGTPNLPSFVSEQLTTYLGVGFDLTDPNQGANTGLGTASSQLVSAGSVQFDASGLVAPTTLPGAVNVSRNSPAGSGDFTVTGYSFAGPDAGLFDLPTFTPTAITAGQQTAAFDLGFNGTSGGGVPLAATLTFTTDTGLDLPVSILAPMSVAADVRVLPDVNPFLYDFVQYANGEAAGTWEQGIKLVKAGESSSNIPGLNTVNAYLELGESICQLDNGLGTCSNQLVAPGQTTVKVWESASPQTIFDAVVIERSSPDSSADLVLDTYAVTGPDAAFFDLDLFTAIAFDPLTDEDASVAFDLIFNPNGLDLAGQTDFAATITFTADTGLEIPVNVSATTVPEPASLALSVLGWVGLMSRRSRRA